MSPTPQLLSDPFLQLPTETSVQVVWFTEFAGLRHSVAYGEGLHQIAIATTTKLSRTREDQISRVKDQTQTGEVYKQPTWRDIWRHEATVNNLSSGVRVPYCVTSVREDGVSISSAEFTLTPKPNPETSLKILLTSDHQLKPMIAANLQQVVETVGRVDAVFFAGDLVNVPDRASEWFDDNRGGAFFPCLQGRGHYELDKNGVKTLYRGGELIQHAPLFTAIGNHEVMGRFSMNTNLNNELDDTIPHAIARRFYQQNSGKRELENILTTDERSSKDNSFNTDTYEEIFTLPKSSLGGKKYYAYSFGDVRLIVLFAANAWRTPSLAPGVRGRYREREEDLNNPLQWGYGQHIFEPIAAGSTQYSWLKQELNSPECCQSKYKVVMLHHPPHSLGDNVVPPYTDPEQVIDRDTNGNIKAMRYEYPQDADYLIRDVVPLLEASGVQLVLYGH
ncbi:MAG: metallophosphoesterase, partial [Chroococcidiopsidaceae cyanobacterium CP_BM_ER_R8_30]|nr:metallophosphoesterase [Chroococcidiopsidaceae cyanobacterium CP_BM_ER_R8_30]